MRAISLERTPLGALACGALALALAACGNGTPAAAHPKARTSVQNAVLTAYRDTLAQKTAHIRLSETLDTSTAGASQQVTITGNGTVDLVGHDGTMTLSIPSLGTIEERILGPEAYLHLPPSLAAKVPGGKSWLSLNLNAITKAKLGATLSQLSDTSQAPQNTLAYLQAVSDDGLVDLGTRTLDGVATTEYRATADFSKIAALRGGAVASAMQRLESQLGSSTLPVTVWVDGADRVRQISYTASIERPSGSSGATSTSGPLGANGSIAASVTVGFSDFGAPVTVVAPPQASVYDATGAALAAGSTSGAASGVSGP